MSWSENRSRPIRREVTFTEDEWKRTQRLYKELTRYAPQHRSFASYARRMLSERRIHVHEIKPLTDPEPLAREIGRIGVNVNQIARALNTAVMDGPVLDLELGQLGAFQVEISAWVDALGEAFEGNLAYWAPAS